MVKPSLLIAASVGLCGVAEAFVPHLNTRSIIARTVRNRPVLLSTTEEKNKIVAEEAGNAVDEVTAVELSGVDEWMIKMGMKDDPRIPEEDKVDTMTKIKSAGTAGIVAYTITEFGFWLTSVPLAIFAVTVTQGAPDMSSTEGQAAVAGYSFAFLTFARTIVPLRIALALALTPWVDENVMSKFKKDE